MLGSWDISLQKLGTDKVLNKEGLQKDKSDGKPKDGMKVGRMGKKDWLGDKCTGLHKNQAGFNLKSGGGDRETMGKIQ